MPSNLKRYHDFGHDHFVTFSCYKRLPFLNNDHARIIFLDTLERLRSAIASTYMATSSCRSTSTFF